jgi:hypothetical protein
MDADSPVAMLAETDSMATWSEDKKKEFSSLFSKRTQLARILCAITVSKFATMAKNRHFISDYHLTKIKRSHGWSPSREYKYEHQHAVKACGRDYDEVARIAELRAKSLLAELPPLKKAVQVIDQETAKKLAKMDRLEKKAEAEKEALEQIPRSIDMKDDAYQDWTLRAFNAEVKRIFDARQKLIKSINKAGEEAHDLEIAVAKALYKGLPGLSEAVTDVIKAHIERSTALDQMDRRVTEQVKFGDSEAATGLLKQFEQDEAAVSDELKGKLNKAMAALKASVKALPKKGKKTKAIAAKKKTAKKKARK